MAEQMRAVGNDAARNELQDALARLHKEILEGLRHGYFDYEIHCEIAKEKKRMLTIVAGKRHRFYIREDEIDGAS